jgi:hypothetical protein
MARRTLRRALGAALVVAATATPLAAANAQPADDPRAIAKDLAERAQDRTDAGDHAGALDLLRQADEAFHAPTIGLLIGRSLIALERFAEAAEHLEDVATEDLPDGSPDAWRNAVKLAGDERAALDGKLGRLVFQIGPASAAATVRIGDRPARPARGEHVVDAGKPTEVRVEAQGHRVAVQRLTVAAGEQSVVALTLQPLAEDAPPPPPDAPAPPPSRSFLHTPWPTVIAGSATALTFAIGAGLGASAFGDAGEIEDRCGDPSCRDASADERRELRALQESGGGTADASTALFVASAACAAATTVFVVLWRTAPPEGSSAPTASVRGGAAWASIDGSF